MAEKLEYKSNPFSIMFGKEPLHSITRTTVIEEIIGSFTEENPVRQLFLITGVRGSGKSALTGSLMNRFRSFDNWIVVDLHVEEDMQAALLGKLSNVPQVKALLQEVNLSVTLPLVSLEMGKKEIAENAGAMLEPLMEKLTKHKKRILIAIDDVVSNDNMKAFSHFYQSCLLKNYSVFLLMNGVYENINALQNERSLTFLHRAPVMKLEPLNLMAIANEYEKVFSFPRETLRKMASLTEGYSYAVQALGYLCWEQAKDLDDVDLEEIIPDYDYLLEESVYDKLWEDMTETDRKIMTAVSENETSEARVKEIMEKSGISRSMLSNYKKKLMKKGLFTNAYGVMKFTLPRFGEFVKRQYDF